MYRRSSLEKFVIQEFRSLYQQLATKKGAASPVEVNLQNALLVHHTKLESKLAN